MAIILSTPMCFHNSTSPWGEFLPSKTRLMPMSSIGYPMVDLTIKLESPQVYSHDHLPNHSVAFWDMFQCTRKSTDLLAIGSSSVSLQQLLISKKLLVRSISSRCRIYTRVHLESRKDEIMLWPVSEYIRSARVLSTCTLIVLPVDQEHPTIHYLTSLINETSKVMSQLSIWGSI